MSMRGVVMGVVVAVVVVGGCGGDDELLVTCNLSGDGGWSTVQFPATEGSTAYGATTGHRVTFTVQEHGKMLAVVTDASGAEVTKVSSSSTNAGGEADGVSWLCSP